MKVFCEFKKCCAPIHLLVLLLYICLTRRFVGSKVIEACDFSEDLCGWSSNSSGDCRWRIEDQKLSVNTTSYSGYALLSKDFHLNISDPAEGYLCVEFLNYLYPRRRKRNLQVLVNGKVHWTAHPDILDQTRLPSYYYKNVSTFKVTFNASCEYISHSDHFLDNITLTISPNDTCRPTKFIPRTTPSIPAEAGLLGYCELRDDICGWKTNSSGMCFWKLQPDPQFNLALNSTSSPKSGYALLSKEFHLDHRTHPSQGYLCIKFFNSLSYRKDKATFSVTVNGELLWKDDSTRKQSISLPSYRYSNVSSFKVTFNASCVNVKNYAIIDDIQVGVSTKDECGPRQATSTTVKMTTPTGGSLPLGPLLVAHMILLVVSFLMLSVVT